MFGNLFNTIKNAIGKKIERSNEQAPSVVGNLITKQPWNKSLPRFGGVKPEAQMIQNPRIVSPLQAPDEITPGMSRQVKLEHARRRMPPMPTPSGPPPTATPARPTAVPTKTPVPLRVTPTVTPKPKGVMLAGPSPAPLPIRQDVADFLESNVFPVTRQAGIPDELAASQFAVEGGRKTVSPINNFFGIGPGWKFSNPEENVKMYAKTVNNILKAKGYNPTKMSSQQIIEALQAGDRPRYEGHEPDPTTYVKTVTNTPEWRYYLSKKR